jgi:hypothetical protein
MHPGTSYDTKLRLWQDFAVAHRIAEQCVPLFNISDGCVTVIPYGRDNRRVLQRSRQMEAMMRKLGQTLINEHADSDVKHNGILYMMLSRENDTIKPRYIGKAEIFGKGDRNLSANISDLDTGNGKFGRWGYNYAYHIGDLSAVTCPGHSSNKATIKYTSWRDALFDVTDGGLIKPKTEILFWATLWGPQCQSIWQEYGSTKLAFEEYLVIGVAINSGFIRDSHKSTHF